MIFTPRYYQTSAIDAATNYFHSSARHHAFEVLPTGSGKSVVIANIAKELDGKTLCQLFIVAKQISSQGIGRFRHDSKAFIQRFKAYDG